MTQEQIDEAVRKLDAMTGDDPEREHGEADAIIEAFLPEELRNAYRRLQERAGGWWYA